MACVVHRKEVAFSCVDQLCAPNITICHASSGGAATCTDSTTHLTALQLVASAVDYEATEGRASTINCNVGDRVPCSRHIQLERGT